MTRINNIAYLLATAAALVLISCSDTTAPDENVSGHPLDNPRSILNDSTELDDSTAFAELQVYRVSHDLPDGTTILSDIMRARLFAPNSETSVDGGSVTLNGIAMNAITNDDDGSTIYEIISDVTPGGQSGIPLNFDGSTHNFAIEGNAIFPALQSGIAAPSQDLLVTSPTAGAVVSRAQGVNIIWNAVNAQAVQILISDAIPETQDIGLTTNDDGMHVINSSDLVSLAPGPLTISISRGNYTITAGQEGEPDHVVAIYSMKQIETTLGP